MLVSVRKKMEKYNQFGTYLENYLRASQHIVLSLQEWETMKNTTITQPIPQDTNYQKPTQVNQIYGFLSTTDKSTSLTSPQSTLTLREANSTDFSRTISKTQDRTHQQNG